MPSTELSNGDEEVSNVVSPGAHSGRDGAMRGSGGMGSWFLKTEKYFAQGMGVRSCTWTGRRKSML